MKEINVLLIDRYTIRTYSLWCFVLILHKDLRLWALFFMYIGMYRLWCFAFLKCVYCRTACGGFVLSVYRNKISVVSYSQFCTQYFLLSVYRAVTSVVLQFKFGQIRLEIFVVFVVLDTVCSDPFLIRQIMKIILIKLCRLIF